MDKYEKFFAQLDARMRDAVAEAVVKIKANDLDGLDLKPIKGKKDFFRVRKGKVRIVFMRTPSGNELAAMDWRDSAYRDL